MNRLEQLQDIPINAITEDDKKFLREQGIINGVWGSKTWKWLRYIYLLN